tara:strand:- start:311 stop:1429 length:1119 start_codon:yes stop_codon:yes gene_type:complete
MSTLKVDNLNGSTGSTITVPAGQSLIVNTITVADNDITTNSSNADLNLTPNGTGKVNINGLKFPTSDGSANQVLATDGSGNISFATVSSTAISQLNTNVTVADTGTNGTVTIQCDGNTEMTVTDDGVRVHGNLTIDGTQTIVNTTTLSVEDNIIEVNRNVSSNAGMPTYSGLKVNRGSASTATEQDLFFVWDESFADDGTTTFGNAGGAWTAFKSANDPLTAATLVDIRANIVHAVATGAQYSDVAERYAADESMPCGTVVEIGGEQEITTAKGEMSENVFGVVSTQPAFMMNASAGNNDSHPFVAMVGRVPVRVIGTANKGDRLVMSEIDGVARTLKDGETAKTERVIGRVLQNKIVNDEHTIECVVQCRV